MSGVERKGEPCGVVRGPAWREYSPGEWDEPVYTQLAGPEVSLAPG